MTAPRPLRLLVAEGNTAEARARQVAFGHPLFGEAYADVLRALTPDAVVDVCYPADAGANLPDAATLADYDGVAITGSALNIYKAEPEAMRQVELARAVFAAGVPFFGSCWGLQVATVAAGGSVRLSPKGREIGLARKIIRTSEGRDHPLHAGKPEAFDAPAVHSDEVDVRPPGMTVTATNRHSEVQAAEIRHGKGTFWGVQYHPEFTPGEMACIFERYGETLVREGPFGDMKALQDHVADLRTLDADPARHDIAWRLGMDQDVLDPGIRLAELRNWIGTQVRPEKSRRGRA